MKVILEVTRAIIVVGIGGGEGDSIYIIEVNRAAGERAVGFGMRAFQSLTSVISPSGAISEETELSLWLEGGGKVGEKWEVEVEYATNCSATEACIVLV